MENSLIRIGGVPEHFNLPIHLAKENNLFTEKGINLEWTTFYGGTGEMTKALRNDEVDICVLLTEGITTDIIRGNPSKIISLYITTPLTWGIHTGNNNSITNYDDIFDKKYAISRFGSGSHLMAIVDANSKGHTLEKDQFEIIKNLDGALDSLGSLDSDVFYWEKFTTKPYVDNDQLRRVGEYKTPWPCFVLAARDEILEKHPEKIIDILKVIHESTSKFMFDDKMILEVSKRYKQKVKDVETWFHSTEWAVHGWVSNKMLKSVVYNLKLAGIIDSDQAIPELVWKR